MVLSSLAAFGSGPLLLCSFGLVVLCLLRTPLRLMGSLLIGAAVVLMLRAPQPDVLVAADGGAVAVRGPGGGLAMVKSGSDIFAWREWLAADADARTPKDATLGQGITCDAPGCIARLPDGAFVAIARSIEAFEEDCRRAVVVVSARVAPADCAALLIDRPVTQRSGAIALRRLGDGFELTAARPAGYDRPWAPAGARMGEGPDARPARPTSAPPRDATPREEDLEAGD